MYQPILIGLRRTRQLKPGGIPLATARRTYLTGLMPWHARLLKYLARRGFEILFVGSWFSHWSISLCFKPSLQAAVHSQRSAPARLV